MSVINADTGVAIIFFNRPEALKKVFDSVRVAQPPALFLIQDGPRSEKDTAGIEACRKVVENVDWPCEVQTNYSTENLGCGRRMSSGITWVFDKVEKAIILEDDCVPSQPFYQFCQELLDKYENDKRILMISGMNHWGRTEIDEDYLFAVNGAIWGWATWKRAWEMFDYTASAIENKDVVSFLMKGVEPKRVAERDVARWKETNRKTKANLKISYWAHQWRLVKMINNNLCIVPKVNLVSNVGDQDGTHPTGGNAKCVFHNMGTSDIEFPLKHPKYVFQMKSYDERYYDEFYPTLGFRIKNKLKRIRYRG